MPDSPTPSSFPPFYAHNEGESHIKINKRNDNPGGTNRKEEEKKKMDK
jgi:hypothetical protein